MASLPHSQQQQKGFPPSLPGLFSQLKTALLLLLICGTLMHAECRKHAARREAIKVWRKLLDETDLPKSLRSLLSPMTSKELNRYMKFLNGNLSEFSSHSTDFCKVADLMCKPDPVKLEFNPSPIERKLFKQADMLVGQQVNLPNLKNSIPARHFLPHAMVSKFELSNKTQNMLNIPSTSRLASYMQKTVSDCEKQASQQEEASICASALEDVVNFIAPKLGSRLEILQTKGPGAPKQNMTVMNMALKGRKQGQDAVVCRDLMFPNTVLRCDVVKNVQTMEVTLQSEDDKEVFTVVMQCSKKMTSHGIQGLMQSHGIQGLIKKHMMQGLFLIPEMKKKKQEMKKVVGEDEEESQCQWMSDNDLVFVNKEGEGGGKKKKHSRKHHSHRFVILP